MKSSEQSTTIFTVAWEFPPIASGESVVCLRTLKYSNYDYDVCCGSSKPSCRYEPTDNIKNYPTRGKYITWPFRAAALFFKKDKEKNYRAMMSRVMPPNGHLAGLIIKIMKPSIKWLVYFSDPVWNSPFIRCSLFSEKDRQRPNYLLMKLFGIPARLAIRYGDLLIFNNIRLARFVLGKNYVRYSGKIVVAPYGHEGVKADVIERKEHSEVVIAHVGQIYGDRTLAEITAALEILKVNNSEIYERIKIQLVGFVCQKELERIKCSGVVDRFEIIGVVDYEKSLQFMLEADYLLVIDPNFNDIKKNIYVPAKIFDYMSAGKPIIAIADEDSATGDIMRNVGKWFVSHTPEDICDLLENVILNREISTVVNQYEKYDCKYNSNRLDDAIQRLLMERD